MLTLGFGLHSGLRPRRGTVPWTPFGHNPHRSSLTSLIETQPIEARVQLARL